MSLFRDLSTQTAVHAFVRLLPHLSEENLERLARLGQTLTDDPCISEAIEDAVGLLSNPENQSASILHQLLARLPADRRTRFSALVLNATLLRGAKSGRDGKSEPAFGRRS